MKKPTLSIEDIAQVKKVARDTLTRLKQEVLMFARWWQSPQLTAQAIVIIRHDIEYLPAASYPDDELRTQETLLYQHIYSRYQNVYWH